MNKFGRNYLLTISTVDNRIDPTGNPIIIKPPFTVEFDITRNILSSANVCSLRIYNLSQTHRNNIRFNFYNQGEYRRISFLAGYGSGVLPLAFSGNITQAWSAREGNNFVTTIECFDGGFAFANSITSATITAGVPQADVFAQLVGALNEYFVTPGYIGSYPGSISRSNSYSGATTDVLRELSQGGFFVDNEKANILGNSEYVPADIVVVNSQSGLLGTPVLQDTILSFEMLFEPGILPGQQVKLESLTAPEFNSTSFDNGGVNVNGFYKVTSIKHRGTISEAVCGDAVTTLEMFYGSQALIPGTLFS